jgi:hypothetical protein
LSPRLDLGPGLDRERLGPLGVGADLAMLKQLVAESHQFVQLGNDAVLFGEGREGDWKSTGTLAQRSMNPPAIVRKNYKAKSCSCHSPVSVFINENDVSQP